MDLRLKMNKVQIVASTTPRKPMMPPFYHKRSLVIANCQQDNDKQREIMNTTPSYEINERLQYHVKNNIRILQHQIQHIMMNTNAHKADISELDDLCAALSDEKRKLKELESEGHDWYDEIYYRDYDS